MARYACVMVITTSTFGVPRSWDVTADVKGPDIVSESMAELRLVLEMAREKGGSPEDFSVVSFSAFELTEQQN